MFTWDVPSVTLHDYLLIVLALIFPFVAVGLKRGFRTMDFFLNLCLLLLFHFPAVLHAIYIILKYPDSIQHTYRRLDEEMCVDASDCLLSANSPNAKS